MTAIYKLVRQQYCIKQSATIKIELNPQNRGGGVPTRPITSVLLDNQQEPADATW
jgi:hypothetical protein